MNIFNTSSTHESSWVLGIADVYIDCLYFSFPRRSRPVSYWNMVRCMRMHSLCRAILYACSLIRICIGSIVFTYVQTQTVYVDTYLHTGPHSSHTLCTIYNPCVHIYTVCVQTGILCVHTASPMKYMFRPCPCYMCCIVMIHTSHHQQLCSLLIGGRHSLRQGLTILDWKG